jgi:hypothetical protein
MQYEEAINTSTDYAPWYVIPADDKEMCRYIVGKIIGKKCRNTLIFKRKWMRKLKKHRIVRCWQKNKKNALKFRAFFY